MYKYLFDKNKNQFYPLVDDKSIVNINTINDIQIEELFNPTVEDFFVGEEYKFAVRPYPSASIGIEYIPKRAGKQAYLDVTTSNPECCLVYSVDKNIITLWAISRGESTITITETNSGISKDVKVVVQAIPSLYTTANDGWVDALTIKESFEQSTFHVEAYPNSGYQFDHWSDGSTDNPRELTIYEDTELTAFFEPILYNVEVRSSNEELGTVSGGGQFTYGSYITISAIPNSGYQFDHWSDGSTENPREITIYENTELTALFGIKMCTVNVVATEGGTVTGSGVYPYGSSVIIEAIPEEGYEFYSWSDGSQSASITINILDSVDIVAIFNDVSGKVIYYTTTHENTLVPNQSDAFGSNLIDNQYN